jgi:hypothetical protein
MDDLQACVWPITLLRIEKGEDVSILALFSCGSTVCSLFSYFWRFWRQPLDKRPKLWYNISVLANTNVNLDDSDG